MPNHILDTQADPIAINLFEKLPGTLSVQNKHTGEPMPEVIISNPIFSLSNNPVGQINPDPSDATKFDFIPKAPGATSLTVSATISIP